MTSHEWWTTDDPAVFGPVAVYVNVGEIPRHQGDFLHARWETEEHPKPGTESEESLLLLGRDGATIEIGAGYVIQVERPQGAHAGKVILDHTWQKGSMTSTRGPATPDSD